ncbi:2'-5' RNA ligase family protein, partial [Onishia taeanensis]
TLDRVGYFPRGGMLWLGSQAPTPALTERYHRLWLALADQGFTMPARPFLPHVTLLRHAQPPPSDALPTVSLSWRHHQLRLIESVTTAKGPRYDTLATSTDA